MKTKSQSKLQTKLKSFKYQVKKSSAAAGASTMFDIFGRSARKPSFGSLRGDGKRVIKDFRSIGGDFRRVLSRVSD